MIIRQCLQRDVYIYIYIYIDIFKMHRLMSRMHNITQ